MNFRKAIEHSITIDPSLNNGFRVTIGCHTFVYTDKKKLIIDLGAYLDNPQETERKMRIFLQSDVIKTMGGHFGDPVS
ncbi:MAG: hypothetical protein SVO01_00285 [Thermotogota bacterium]|nr:hypothetical protein [Thermotogota bacterium]